MIPKLSGPILAGILVLGVLAVGLSFDDAEAKRVKEQIPTVVGTIIEIRGNTIGTCASGTELGSVKAKVQFILRVDNVNEDDYDGVAKAKFKLNPTCNNSPKELINDGQFAFSYDAELNELIISGVMKDRDEAVYSFEGIGSFSEEKPNGNASVEMLLTIEGIDAEFDFENGIFKKKGWSPLCHTGGRGCSSCRAIFENFDQLFEK